MTISTATVGHYLVTIFQLTQDQPWARTGQIAAALDVRLSTVSEMLKRLDGQDYIVHQSRTGARLTPTGQTMALSRLRKRRILETFLVEIVGYELDEIHDEACRMEHVLSDRLTDRLDELLGYPPINPYGHPIPSRDGKVAAPDVVALTDIETGCKAVIRRLDDDNSEKINYLQQLALMPGRTIQVIDVAPFNGPITVAVEGQTRSIAVTLADEIKVEPLED